MRYTMEQIAFALANFVNATGDQGMGVVRLDDRLVAVYGGRDDQAGQCFAELRQELKAGEGRLGRCFGEAAYSAGHSGEATVLLLHDRWEAEGGFDDEEDDTDERLAVVDEAVRQAWADARRAVLAEGGTLSARELAWQRVQTAWLDALLPHEVTVGADVAGPTDTRRAFVGSGYEKALEYFQDHMKGDGRLVHGRVTSPGHGARFASAWVELPGDVVYDPMTERHYRREGFYAVLGAENEAVYDRREAAGMVADYETYGPWHEEA